MADKRLAVVDPSGRLIAEIEPLTREARISLVPIRPGEPASGCAAMLVAALVASDVGPLLSTSPPRWIVGDGGNPARLAGAASQAGAVGVLLTPVSLAALEALADVEPTIPEFDLVRARGLIATSLVDLPGTAAESLL